MPHELYYTAAERGVDLGRSGFCTVARTRGLPRRLERVLHELSVYKAIYPPHDPRFGQNPVIYMHTRTNIDGQELFILSRIAAAPPDYSGRRNYFAHHVALSASELTPAGPTWLVRQPNFLATHWDGQIREWPQGRAVPQGNSQPRRCTTWEHVTGDAGWAGLILKFLSENLNLPIYLIVDDSAPVLDLLDEVISLLPPEKRWSVTFTTRYIYLPNGVSCAVRAVSPSSEKIAEARASLRMLDLTALPGKPPPDDPYCEAARTGQFAIPREDTILAFKDPVATMPAIPSTQPTSGKWQHPLLAQVAPTTAVPLGPPSPPKVRAIAQTPTWLVLSIVVQFGLITGLAVSVFSSHQRQLALEKKISFSAEIATIKQQEAQEKLEFVAELQKTRIPEPKNIQWFQVTVRGRDIREDPAERIENWPLKLSGLFDQSIKANLKKMGVNRELPSFEFKAEQNKITLSADMSDFVKDLPGEQKKVCLDLICNSLTNIQIRVMDADAKVIELVLKPQPQDQRGDEK